MPQTRTRTVRDCLTPSFATRFEMSFALGELDADAYRHAARRLIEREQARGISGPGKKRQTAAIFAAPAREVGLAALPGLGIPVMMIHGTADPLIRCENR